MEKGATLYKQFHNYVPVNKMEGLQWFALKPVYGDNYGNVHKKYRVKRALNLLNIGDGNVREMIEFLVPSSNQTFFSSCNPNDQYSGGRCNANYHNEVKKLFSKKYDGTIIDENNLVASSKYSIDDLEGPSEVVLWDKFSKLVKEEKSVGGTKRGRPRSGARTERRLIS
jgi:hypothetical protein